MEEVWVGSAVAGFGVASPLVLQRLFEACTCFWCGKTNNAIMMGLLDAEIAPFGAMDDFARQWSPSIMLLIDRSTVSIILLIDTKETIIPLD